MQLIKMGEGPNKNEDELRSWAYKETSSMLARKDLETVILISSDKNGEIIVGYNGDSSCCEKMGMLDLAKQLLIEECKGYR